MKRVVSRWRFINRDTLSYLDKVHLALQIERPRTCDPALGVLIKAADCTNLERSREKSTIFGLVCGEPLITRELIASMGELVDKDDAVQVPACSASLRARIKRNNKLEWLSKVIKLLLRRVGGNTFLDTSPSRQEPRPGEFRSAEVSVDRSKTIV